MYIKLNANQSNKAHVIAGKYFKHIRQISKGKFLMYFIRIINILVDNDVNKVHLKLSLDTYLIRLKFFPAIRWYYLDRFLLIFTQKNLIIIVLYTSLFLFNFSSSRTKNIPCNAWNELELRISPVRCNYTLFFIRKTFIRNARLKVTKN